MKSDLDRLMAARNLDVLLVCGDEHANPPRHYLTNGAMVTGGYVLRRRGGAPVMIVNPMETEEAAKSGLETHSYNDYGWGDLYKQMNGDQSKATVVFWKRLLQGVGVESGRVGVYGAGEIHKYLELIRLVEAEYSEYQFIGETGMTLFDGLTSPKTPTRSPASARSPSAPAPSGRRPGISSVITAPRAIRSSGTTARR